MDNEATNLFYWMSHLGQGSIRQLSRAAETVANEHSSMDAAKLANIMRDRGLRLGDITIVDRTRWRVRAPSIAFIRGQEAAFWRGGMAPMLTSHIASITQHNNCSLVWDVPKVGYRRLFINGAAERIKCIADDAQLRIETNSAHVEAHSMPKLQDMIASSADVELPTTGEYSIYDYDRLNWTPAERLSVVATTAAVRLKSHFGSTTYYARHKGRFFKVDSELNAIYLTAPRAMLCEYNSATCEFHTRVRLPYRYALPLCLCSGRTPSQGVDRRQTYTNIPFDIADLVLSRLGQQHSGPTIYWLT